MRNLTILLVCAGIILPYSPLYAQETLLQDSTQQNIQRSYAIKLYEATFSGPNSPVYQGREYLPYAFPTSGNAFFVTNEWQEGSVCFKGKLYSHLPLLYDILKDQLVLQSWNKIYRIHLSQQNVSRFIIGTHHFIRINNNDSSGKSFPPAGYYEELVYGTTRLLAKRIKTVEAPASTGTTSRFVEDDRYYIEKANHYYPVRTKRSVLKVLHDHKREIKQYIRKNDIRFGLNKEAAMVEIVKYDNRLNHQGT